LTPAGACTANLVRGVIRSHSGASPHRRRPTGRRPSGVHGSQGESTWPFEVLDPWSLAGRFPQSAAVYTG
jgi:hypothetical protein